MNNYFEGPSPVGGPGQFAPPAPPPLLSAALCTGKLTTRRNELKSPALKTDSPNNRAIHKCSRIANNDEIEKPN